MEAESINEILQQSQRLQMLIENMLMLSRLERGMASEPAEPQLLQRVVPGMVKAFCEQHRDVLVELSLAPDLPPVEVEQTTVDQVLSNLLTNAAKYGPAGRPIRVEASQVGAEVLVAVQDEGTSIPPEELPRLFDPFYRTESAASRGETASVSASRSANASWNGPMGSCTRPSAPAAAWSLAFACV